MSLIIIGFIKIRILISQHVSAFGYGVMSHSHARYIPLNIIHYVALHYLSFTDYISELISLQLMALTPFTVYPFKKEPTGFLYRFIIDRAWLWE